MSCSVRLITVVLVIAAAIGCGRESGPAPAPETSAAPPEPALTRPITLRFYKDPAPAPIFEVQTLTGRRISSADLVGKVTVINFWATWCGPCRLEMPEFQNAYENHAGEGFSIIAVNNRENVADVIGFREEYGLTFPLAMDEQGEIQDRYGVLMYPSTYVIGRDGTVMARHFGALTAGQIQELLDRALG